METCGCCRIFEEKPQVPATAAWPCATVKAMDRIDVNPEICSGKPVIRGTRILVSNILGMVAGGYSADRILEAYPELTGEDITSALEYAARVIDEEQLIPG